MIAFAAIEWTWGEAILNESWRDVIAVGGLLVTVIGFGIAIWQLRKTQSAAMAAEATARKTLDVNRLAYHKFAVALAHRYVHEVKIYVDDKAWDMATMRLSDLCDQLNQLAVLDQMWSGLANEIHGWSVTCNQLKNGERKRFPDKEKWLEFCARLEAKLNQALGPFVDLKGT